MNEFEQMMANISVPEEIATQLSGAAKNGEILAVWERLAPAVDEAMLDASTAAGVCAIGMMVAYIGDKLSQNVKFGESPEDEGKNVHPNFCIMAIAMLAVNTWKANQAVQQAANNGDGDGGEEKGSEEESGEEDQAGSDAKPT